MLKPVINSLDEVPEALHGEYTPKDGKFVLDVNIEEHPGVAGLRNALTNVRTEKATLKTQLEQFSGMDPAKVKELQENERKIKEGELIAAGKLDELVNMRTGALKEDLTKKLSQSENERTALQSQLNTLVIDNAVQAAAAKLGVRESALDDVLARARNTFRTHEGRAVAFNGENPVYSKNGSDLLGIEEWMTNLPNVAPHLFKESKGGGAGGGTPKAVAGPGTVSRTDPASFLANIDAIAKGKMKVV